MLSDKMHGNYTIVCGNCDHHHYRHISGGIVTEDRHNHAADHGDTVHVMKSASYEKKPIEKLGKIAQFRAKVAAGLAS